MFQPRTQSGNALLWVLLLVVIAAGAVYYFYFMDPKAGDNGVVSPPPPIVSEPEPEPERQSERESEGQLEQDRETEQRDRFEATVPEPAEPEETEPDDPLPSLAESDGEALQVAGDLVGEDAARSNLVTEGVISRLVATVDALTREELPENIVPVRGPGGDFQVTSDGVSQEINPETGLPEPRYVLDPVNFQRYTPQVEILEAVDIDALVAQYDRYAPLLQESYRGLGYPEGDFEDRLVEVIDHLLAAPEPERPVRLVKPEAFYEFEDPELEALSAGQKALIRMGPSNAARVRAKLSEIRAALQTQRE